MTWRKHPVSGAPSEGRAPCGIITPCATRESNPWPTAGCEVKSSQVVYFRNTSAGVHERTSMKEPLVRHGSKHKIQVHTTKRNKRQQKQKQNRTHFQNKKPRETRERSLTKTKARGKTENRWVQQTHRIRKRRRIRAEVRRVVHRGRCHFGVGPYQGNHV